MLGIGIGAASARIVASFVGPLPELGAGQIAATVGVLGAARLLTLVGPIHRAGRIEPMAVLREE